MGRPRAHPELRGTVTASPEAHQRVRALAAEVGLVAPDELRSDPTIAAAVLRVDGASVLVLHPALLEAPDRLWRGVVVHELAHLALGHAGGRLRSSFLQALQPPVLTIATVTVFVLSELALGGPWTHRFGRALLAVLLWTTLAAVGAWWSRRREAAADALATHLGHPPNAEMAALGEALSGRPRYRLLETHPSWERRIRRS